MDGWKWASLERDTSLQGMWAMERALFMCLGKRRGESSSGCTSCVWWHVVNNWSPFPSSWCDPQFSLCSLPHVPCSRLRQQRVLMNPGGFLSSELPFITHMKNSMGKAKKKKKPQNLWKFTYFFLSPLLLCPVLLDKAGHIGSEQMQYSRLKPKNRIHVWVSRRRQNLPGIGNRSAAKVWKELLQSFRTALMHTIIMP